MMKNSAPPANLLRLTLATLFSAVGDQLSEVAAPTTPKTLPEHLIVLFMSVTEFYHAQALPMPTELVTLLRDMHQAAHRADGAHALELMRAVHIVSHRPGLRNDTSVRLALSGANTALIQIAR